MHLRRLKNVKIFSEASLNKVYNGRVNDGPPSRVRLVSYPNQMPPQRISLRIMPSSLFVVVAFACLLLDPRDPRQVIIVEGVHPHPGPDHGIVKQAVETIEEAMQRRKRREDREPAREEDTKPESCWSKKAKQLRYRSPSQEVCGSNASTTLFSEEGNGKLLRDKGGNQEAGMGKSKNKNTMDEPQSPRAPKCPKVPPKTRLSSKTNPQ